MRGRKMDGWMMQPIIESLWGFCPHLDWAVAESAD